MLNPMQLMGMLQHSNNPLLARAMQMSRGKSPRELAYIARNLAHQQGMNDQQFAQFLNQFGMKV